MALELAGISKSYARGGRAPLRVLDNVSLAVREGDTVGLVGESGSGKTTLIRCALRLAVPDEGSVTYEGINVLAAEGRDLFQFRQEVQLVFQDPYASLNPRMTVEQLIGEGLIVHHLERSAAKRRTRVKALMETVGLNPDDIDRYSRSFSGGQRQRIAIARALAIRPRILVCDEPVSALDVSVQAQVLNLLQDMQRQFGLGILFVAHDLAIVRHLCRRVAVLRGGSLVEMGDVDQIFDAPRHPYTRSLLEAVPIPDPLRARERRAARRAVLSSQSLEG
jgi:oligopeptide transport system ATP-binding protein